MDTKKIKFTVYGLVQGVGFRYFVARNASSLGLRGFVRNEYDGSVTGVAVGPATGIEKLKQLLQVGPSRANVDKVLYDDYIGDENFTHFEIR